MNENERDKMNAVTKIKTNDSKPVNNIKQLEESFLDAMRRGVDAWKEAGAILVQISEQDEGAIKRIQAKSGLSDVIIRTFLRIGRGELLASLVTAPEYIKRLPITDQKRIAEGSVEALVLKPDGSTETIKIDVMRSDPRIIKQVIGKDGIRSLSEQKQSIVATVNSELATKAAGLSKRVDSAWWVDGKSVVITSGKYSRRDIQTMLNAIL